MRKWQNRTEQNNKTKNRTKDKRIVADLSLEHTTHKQRKQEKQKQKSNKKWA